MTTQPAYSQTAYPAIQSDLHLGGPSRNANIEKWRPILDKHAAALLEVSSEGKPSAIDRHTSRGQLLGQSYSLSDQ
jgi:hypothetical protein